LRSRTDAQLGIDWGVTREIADGVSITPRHFNVTILADKYAVCPETIHGLILDRGEPLQPTGKKRAWRR